MENSMEISQRIKDRTTIWSRYSTSEYLYKEHKNTSLKRYVHLRVHCHIIHNSQDPEAT